MFLSRSINCKEEILETISFQGISAKDGQNRYFYKIKKRREASDTKSQPSALVVI